MYMNFFENINRLLKLYLYHPGNVGIFCPLNFDWVKDIGFHG